MSQEPRTPLRPREHLVAAGQLYPGAWKQVDEWRARRGQGGVPNWPDWCFLPLGAWYAIVSEGEGRLPPHLVEDVSRLGAVGTWRVTQGIYRFDPALFGAIAETPVSGDLPHDVLYRLPEWCVYVETPGLAVLGGKLHGFFAHLECDANTGRPELRLLLNAEQALAPVPLHLGPWPLLESIDRAVSHAGLWAAGYGIAIPEGASQAMRPIIEPLVSLLLYLCAENAEIGAGDRHPANPKPTRTKKGPRTFPPDNPTTWDVGVRIGSALRRAFTAQETGQGGTHASPRPHVRRAHWHGFWTGPRNHSEERKLALKWLPPIGVRIDSPDDLPATVRPVREKNR